jgi:hypothetical protein
VIRRAARLATDARSHFSTSTFKTLWKKQCRLTATVRPPHHPRSNAVSQQLSDHHTTQEAMPSHSNCPTTTPPHHTLLEQV